MLVSRLNPTLSNEWIVINVFWGSDGLCALDARVSEVLPGLSGGFTRGEGRVAVWERLGGVRLNVTVLK